MKYIAALPLKQKYYAPIEREINALFDLLIYAPIISLIRSSGLEIHNAIDPLGDAIKSGRVYLRDGVFVGKFSAEISKQFRKLGAKYSIFKKGWQFPGDIPSQIIVALTQNDLATRALMNDIVANLNDINVDYVVDRSGLGKKYATTIEEMNQAFLSSIKGISIAPKLTPAARDELAAQWGKNLELYVSGWVKEDIIALRVKIQDNAFNGGRAEHLEKTIADNYKVSRHKAKFLARQETSLLMSKFREQRYSDIGSVKYRWSGSNDERERPDHKALNGKVFFWSSPPVTNRTTGARNNPGEDFGCRCVAIPILPGFDEL